MSHHKDDDDDEDEGNQQDAIFEVTFFAPTGDSEEDYNSR